jgi:hypothetical protein
MGEGTLASPTPEPSRMKREGSGSQAARMQYFSLSAPANSQGIISSDDLTASP